MVDNRPISVVVSDTNRWDYRGKVAVDMGQYRLADSLLTLYLGVDPHSETMLIMKTLADAALGDIDDVYDRAKIGISRYLKITCLCITLGLAQAFRGETDAAIASIESAFEAWYSPDVTSLDWLIKLYSSKGNTYAADHYNKILQKLSHP